MFSVFTFLLLTSLIGARQNSSLLVISGNVAFYGMVSAVLYISTDWIVDCSRRTVIHGGKSIYDLQVSQSGKKYSISIYGVLSGTSNTEMFSYR